MTWSVGPSVLMFAVDSTEAKSLPAGLAGSDSGCRRGRGLARAERGLDRCRGGDAGDPSSHHGCFGTEIDRRLG